MSRSITSGTSTIFDLPGNGAGADPEIVMLGDSLTEWGNWHELVPEHRVINRGIAGDTSSGVLDRLQEVIERRPKVVFVMIGTNDIGLQSAPYARSSAAPTESP